MTRGPMTSNKPQRHVDDDIQQSRMRHACRGSQASNRVLLIWRRATCVPLYVHMYGPDLQHRDVGLRCRTQHDPGEERHGDVEHDVRRRRAGSSISEAWPSAPSAAELYLFGRALWNDRETLFNLEKCDGMLICG